MTMMSTLEAARALGGRSIGPPVSFGGVSTDTRTLAPGDLFVAIQGDRVDAHAFVGEALAKGAAAALVARDTGGSSTPQVVVEDTRLGLGHLAAAWRKRFALPVLALTGSNGKTTTKEMLAAILAEHAGTAEAVLATRGNLNNDIGLPLTVLRLREHHRYAVLEMGMNHLGEIAYLTRIARPGAALVTNAHRAHVGVLGSLDAIAQAKGEIYEGLDEGGIALVNADDPYAAQWLALNPGRRTVRFGFSEGADVRGHLAGTEDGAQLRLITPADAFAVTLQVAGEHNARNAIAACAAAFALEIPPHAIQAGLSGFAGVPGRQQKRAGRGGATVIDDTYNANPESMKAAIDVLAAAPGRKVFVMGDMGEVGEGEVASRLHAEVGAHAKARGLDALLALGPASAAAAEAFGAKGRHFGDLESLVAAAERELAPGATVLVKGSRFMQMERVAGRLASAKGGGDAA